MEITQFGGRLKFAEIDTQIFILSHTLTLILKQKMCVSTITYNPLSHLPKHTHTLCLSVIHHTLPISFFSVRTNKRAYFTLLL